MEQMEYLGRYRLLQSPDCFRLGRDSVLLSRFATVKPGWRVCDLGCGVGSLLLLLSERFPDLERFGVEIDPAACALAQHNLRENNLSGTVLEGDLRQVALPPDSFQLVITNPPYFRQGSGYSGGPTRMEEQLSIKELCAAAGRLLRTRGCFAVVFRPERLAELFSAMELARLTPKRMQLLSYDREKPPYAVLVEGRKDGGPGLSVLPSKYQEG